MSPNPRPGGTRTARPALVALAFVLVVAAVIPWGQPARPSAVDAGDLAAAQEGTPCGEAIVTGEWVSTKPAAGHLLVILRGRDGGSVMCHFEDVPTADRVGLEARLIRTGEVAVHGRCGIEDGEATLRGCSLLD